MITIELTPNEIRELSLLEEGQTIDVEYHGLPCFIAYYGECGNVEINGRKYSLGFYDPTEWRIKESKRVTVRIMFFSPDGETEHRVFETYRCRVEEDIVEYIRYNPELSKFDYYTYSVFDDRGRQIR